MQFGGAFWQTFRGFQMPPNTLDQLLGNESTTINDVLNDDNVIQELKNQNSKLIEFLNKERIASLIEIITVFPPEDADHKRGHKFPFITSELFACECWPLLDLVLSEKDLLDQLFHFLRPSDINSTLAGYFSKLVLSLISRNSNIVLDFITSNSLEVVLAQKIYSKSIADLVIKILSIENQNPDQPYFLETRKNLLNHVLSQLNEENSMSHYFVAVIVNDLISKALETNFWKELVSSLTASDSLKLLSDSAKSRVGSKVTASLSIFKSLLCNNVKSEILKPQKLLITEDDSTIIEDEETSEFVKVIIDLFQPLVHMLIEPPLTITSTNSTSLCVLGETRLRTVEFFYSCIKIDIKEILSALIKFQVFQAIIQIFFVYEMNSMLHGLIEQIIFTCINSSIAEEDLIDAILVHGKLVEKICEGCEKKGYAGHAIKISSDLIKSAERNEHTRRILQNSPEWKTFNDNYLQKRLDIEKKSLGDNSNTMRDDISSEENNPSYESHIATSEQITNLLKKSNNSENNDMEVDNIEEEKDDKPMDIDDLNAPDKEPSPEKKELAEKLEESEDMKIENQLITVEQQPDEEPSQVKNKNIEENKEENRDNIEENRDNMAIDKNENVDSIEQDLKEQDHHEKIESSGYNNEEIYRDNSDCEYWKCFYQN